LVWDHGYLAAFVFVAAILTETVAIHSILPMLARGGAVRENYRGDLIPVGGGLTFPVTVLIGFIIVQLSMGYTGNRYGFYLIALLSMAFLGFIDDMLGQRDALGFRGHFTRLLKKRELTTGGLKALGGGAVALYISLFFSHTLIEFLVNVLVIALFTNSMNLFDLRPGRCVKVFFVLFLPLFLWSDADSLLFIPLAGAVLAYFPYDLKARVMMGDTGSNVLGVTLGVMAVFGLDFIVRVVLVVLLLLLHFYTERYSLSHVIARNRFLNWLDWIGRSDGESGKQGKSVGGFSGLGED